MAMFVLFGVKDPAYVNVDEVAQRVADLLGAPFVKRVGEERGHYCTIESGTDEEIQLVPGTLVDEDGVYPAEPNFPDWKFLLYLEHTNEGSVWLKTLRDAASEFQQLRPDAINAAKT